MIDYFNYTKKNYDIKKIELENVQNELAIFLDKNQIISSSIFSNKLRVLENKYNIANQMFMELSKHLEEARLQINKDTPVIVNIKAPTISNNKSIPKRTMMVLAWSFVGMVTSILYLLFYVQAKVL